MKTWRVRLAALGLAGLVLAAPNLARASEGENQDQALSLREHGDIHALSDILSLIRTKVPGDVVSVDLVRIGGMWLYRLQIVTPLGLRTTIDVDAGAGAIVHGESGD